MKFELFADCVESIQKMRFFANEIRTKYGDNEMADDMDRRTDEYEAKTKELFNEFMGGR